MFAAFVTDRVACEQASCSAGVEGDVAKIVDADRRDAAEPSELAFEAPGALNGREAIHAFLCGG